MVSCARACTHISWRFGMGSVCVSCTVKMSRFTRKRKIERLIVSPFTEQTEKKNSRKKNTTKKIRPTASKYWSPYSC